MGAVRRIAQQYQGQKVMVVTHGGVLDMIWRIARGTALDGPRQSDIPNTDLNRVRVNCKEVVDWAVVRHLANLSEQSVYDQKKPLVR
jgi:2,3-bisphosphoglycerate-dependent phosphoglycerate mutase